MWDVEIWDDACVEEAMQWYITEQHMKKFEYLEVV